MMLQAGSCHCFSFLFLLFTLHLCPTLAYFLKDCTILYSDNVTAGVSVDCCDCKLDSVPEDIPRDVISLTLKRNNIHKIHRTDFYNMTNLTYLDLSANPITHVDDGAFFTLVRLKELNMEDNLLTTLTDSMFQGLSNLLVLDFLTILNNIQFNPVAFQSLTSLQELSLYSDQMTDIISVLQLPRLRVLELWTVLESFQSKDLPSNVSSELRELRVVSDSIKTFSISTAVFPHLKTIDLSVCCNTSGWEWDIPDKYILRNITEVHLTGSNMSYNTIRKTLQSLNSLEYLQLHLVSVWIDRDLLNIVCKIPTLRTLDLSWNTITSISETLSPCTQLSNLDLSHNYKLTELPKDSIKVMKQLSHLNLSWNDLSKVPDDVKNLSMLQVIGLSHNQISDLSCSDFLNLTRLTHLHLDYNHIFELKGCIFEHLNELKVLTVNHNYIKRFGDNTGLKKLESLELNYNDFMFMIINGSSEFTSLKSLKHLDVGFGWNKDWDKDFLDGLDELETLGIHFNITSSPPHELQQQYYNTTLLNSLKSLTIQSDSQNYFLSKLSVMKHLKHFNFYGGVPPDLDTYKYVPQLKTLSLINCNLTSLDFLAQDNLTRLSWLDLSQNELTVINVSVFSFVPALKFIKMNDNPLACECSNADFLQWMHNNNQTLVVDAHRYTCAYPLAKKGTRFLDFDIHSCWVDASFICFLSSTCVIVLTLLTCFTYHFLRLHLLYGYYLFLAFLYDAKERKKGSPQRYDAFISYNVHDELWVYREMLPVLEGEQGWKLCLHHRDFPPGKPIIENITDAIYGSRKIICVISHHYLESEWCSREIQMASYRLFDEQKDVLILVFLEDIPAHQLSPYYHMKRLVKSHTYLSWSQAGQHPGLFWQNLRRALDTPHADLGLKE